MKNAAEETGSAGGRVLLAGLADDVVQALAERVKGAQLHAVDQRDALLEELQGGRWDLLVVDPGFFGGDGVDLVDTVRALASGGELPILCCVHSTLPVEVARHLADSLKVARLLFHPLEVGALAEQIASILPRQDSVQPDGGVSNGLAALWEKFRGVTMERVASLEHAAAALSTGRLDPELRQRAENDAHKLAGGLGTFGYMQGSRIAHAAEMLLQGDLPLGPADGSRLSGWIKELRDQLEDPPRSHSASRTDSAPAPAVAGPDDPLLWIVSADPDFAERVGMEAKARGLRVEHAPEAATGDEAPDALAAIVDLSGSIGEATLSLVEKLTQRNPPPVVIAVSDRDTFEDRVEVARRGARSFFRKPLPPGVVVDRLAQLLARGEVAGSKVLIVADDGRSLAALRLLLETRNINAVSVSDPQQFWSRMESTRPDLVVLDQDMADLRGEDICRTLRLDLRWQDLPVLFLASTLDPATVQSIFAAGANDFVRKPFVGPELLSRIGSHLERARLLQSLRERTGPLGLPARARVMEEVTRLLQIAGRQGESVALGRIDLDQLARINESVGAFAADEVLRQIALLLQISLRAGDVVGWWSGDEFVVAMYATGRELAVARLNQVREAARAEPIEVNGQALEITFSAGVAQFPMDGQDFRQLSGAAEGALRAAKEAGGNRVVVAGDASDAARAEVLDVVLIDEDDALANLLLHALDAEGLRTRRVRDGSRARELFAGPDPALCPRVILLGVDPSHPEGVGVLRMLSREGVGSRSHVIALTAHGTEQEALDVLDAGAADYIAKPFSIVVLLQRIWSALQRT